MTRIASWDKPELNLELFFCTEVLKLNSLHYGFWEQEEKLNLDSVRQAQTRYTDTLLDMIPADVHKILDIGCGIGDNARALKAKGYQVTAISPDRNHAAYFETAESAGIHFINTGIETFSSPEKYDLVLMSESQGYFAMDMGFSQSVRHLRPGGYLLVSGIFKQDGKDGFEGSHIEGEYIRCAQDFGLLRKESVDITDNILPTLAFANDTYQRYLTPLTQTAQHFVGKGGMRKWQLLKALFSREFNNFEEVRRYYEEHFNTTFFKEKMRYTRILFQYQPDAFEASLIEKRAASHAVSVIVSAYNEEKTVGAILSALSACELVDEVIAVNDGSGDNTGAAIQTAALNEKVVPIQFEQNLGKSRAMVTAALRARGDMLVFFDADLLNAESRHVQELIQPLLDGKADMVIGNPQYASSLVKLFDPFRPLSGQRAVRRKDLLPILEEIRNSGYGIETLLNLTYKQQKLKTVFRNLEGLIHPIKLEKDRPAKATKQYLEEGSQIATALINRAGQKQGFYN
jgi:SAM-dependent methyltransferase